VSCSPYGKSVTSRRFVPPLYVQGDPETNPEHQRTYMGTSENKGYSGDAYILAENAERKLKTYYCSIVYIYLLQHMYTYQNQYIYIYIYIFIYIYKYYNFYDMV